MAVPARNLAKAATVHLGLLYNNPSAAYLNELRVGVLARVLRRRRPLPWSPSIN
jgi:hypothetical protein